ncbi:translation initiation factor IF-2 N-terminal domain-containing protein, partial [candidate division KSB1 bacterium]
MLGKKIRIHQLAKELNIGSDALISFLKEKKYRVSSIMTPINEEMYDDIMKKFEPEKLIA